MRQQTRKAQINTRRQVLALAVATCFATGAQALPTGPSGLVGVNPADIVASGKAMTITTASQKSMANWQSFSIDAGQMVKIIQPGVTSRMLNNVVGVNGVTQMSEIYGTLSSNGQVWLINPAGITVGAGGIVDTAGFVASTLKVRPEDFLAGQLNFQATSGAGDVVNQGTIRTPSGGFAYLVGTNVSNAGIITTPNGETILAAGATVNLIDTGTPGVKVEITGASNNATNLGTITAEAGRIGIAGSIVKNSGTLNASSVTSEGGRIFLKASQDAYVDGNGRIVATGTKGGQVEVLGNRVSVMDNASIDASGTNGGGKILVGGDYQGKNATIQNSQITYFGPNATLKANATEVGDGGTVIVWADDTTRAYGSIEAKGINGGRGGFVETSGKRYLDVNGIRINTVGGTWLLDPVDICVYGGDPAICSTGYSMLSSSLLSSALNSNNVVIETSGGTVTGGGLTLGSSTGGNVEFKDAYVMGGAAYGLSILAYGGATGTTGNISFTNTFMSIGTNLTMVAGWDGGSTTAPTRIAGKGDIALNGGTVGTWIQAGSMNINANNLTLTGGNTFGANSMDPNYGAGVILQQTNAYGSQSINIGGTITLQAGSVNNTLSLSEMYGGSAGIWASGTQNVSATNIRIYGGAGGHDNSAGIRSTGATQNIVINGGQLLIQGGGGAGGYMNRAGIEQFGPTGATQNITVYGGGSILLQAGSGTGTGGWDGGGENTAGIRAGGQAINDTINQNIDFVNGGSLTLIGGSAGIDNYANIEAGYWDSTSDMQYGGNQWVGSSGSFNPTILIQGGSGGGSVGSGLNDSFSNDAGIFSGEVGGLQTIYANSLTINGGSAEVGGAGIGSQSIQIYTNGNLTMTGGTSNTLVDGTPFGSGVFIGNMGDVTIDISVGGSFTMIGGTGASAMAWIGSVNGQLNSGDIGIEAASISMVRGTSPALISSYGGQIDLVSTSGNIALDKIKGLDNVYVEAAGAIIDNNGTGVLNIAANSSIELISLYGNPNGIAISADTQIAAGGSIFADASGTYGGIRIANDGSLGAPSSVMLMDGTINGGPMTFAHAGSLDSSTSLYFSTEVGDIAINVTGNLVEDGSNLAVSTPGNALVTANGDMEINTTVTNSGSLSLAAGGTLTNYGTIYAGGALTLAAPIIWNEGSTVSNASTVITAGDYVSYGGSVQAYGALSNIEAKITNNMSLYDGAGLFAGNDVKLIFSGGFSTLSLNNGSHIYADMYGPPYTIYLDFLGRSSGGILIDGINALPTDYGSVFFNAGLPAEAGTGLVITYSQPPLDPCAQSPEICQPPPPNEPFIEPIIVETCATNPALCPAVIADEQLGGEGEFGEEENKLKGKKKAAQCKG